MNKILVCAHPWRLVQARQLPFVGDPMPAVYQCPICQSGKSDGDPDPRIVIARLEEENA